MNENAHRNILVAVSGLTPQIITETLYNLVAERKVIIDGIQIITTSVGKKIVEEEFLRPRGPYYEFCDEYGLMPHKISIDVVTIKDASGNDLEDIRTREDNECMARTIINTVFSVTRNPNTRVFASVAGGRKTMSAYMALAMQLFGREQDRLMHVLVWPPELESDRNFYYPPKDKREIKTGRGDIVLAKDIRIDLAEIPFIRLRDTIQDEVGANIENYLDLIELSQFKINELKKSLICEWKIKEHRLNIKLGQKEYSPVSIPGKLAAIYHTLIEKKHASLSDEFIEEMKQNYAKYYRERDFSKKSYGKTWDIQQVQKDISTIRKRISKSLPAPLAKQLTIDSKVTFDQTEYFINLPPRIVR